MLAQEKYAFRVRAMKSQAQGAQRGGPSGAYRAVELQRAPEVRGARDGDWHQLKARKDARGWIFPLAGVMASERSLLVRAQATHAEQTGANATSAATGQAPPGWVEPGEKGDVTGSAD